MNCSVCNVNLPGPNEIAQHFTGKRHLKAVANIDLRLKQEGRAVYVTRLGHLSLPDIVSFFQKNDFYSFMSKWISSFLKFVFLDMYAINAQVVLQPQF